MTECRWVATDQPRALIARHADDCPGQCAGCEPCTEPHCGICGIEHPVERICPACIGATRADLADLATLHALLPDQAVHHANAPIPGGTAAVMLGPWSQGEAQQWAETYGRDTSHKADEYRSDPIPTLQVLATWEDDWRDHLGDPEGPRATVTGCVAYLSRVLHTVAQTHDAYPEFVSMIRQARAHLEAVLIAGNRAFEGARCLNVECGALLRQPYVRPERCTHSTPARAQLAAWLTYQAPVPRPLLRAARQPCGRTGCDQGGRRDDWRCPACKRRYTEDEYRKANAQEAAELSPLRPGPDIARSLGVRPGRVRLWVHRGQITKAGADRRGRALYDIREARRLAMAGGIAC